MGVYWRGITHDLSKFLPSEFIPYAKYFYGDYGINNKCPAKWLSRTVMKVKNDFDFAWLLHQKRNKHHWQYWILREDDGDTKIFEITNKYTKEMICDWDGAGMAISGKNNTEEWYLKNRDKMQLHPNTIEFINRRLKHRKQP